MGVKTFLINKSQIVKACFMFHPYIYGIIIIIDCLKYSTRKVKVFRLT